MTMSCIAVNKNNIVVAKGLHIDCFDGENHKIIKLNRSNIKKDDIISDLVISSDNKYLALITSFSKQLIIYDLPAFKEYRAFELPKSASKIRFATDNTRVLVADKTGDGLIYNITAEESGKKLLGHLSLLLNILQTNDGKYIITADRDEKIRVTCFPNTYTIHTYCLGHREFVNNLELLPHNDMYLISTSGDGTIKCWDYAKGTLSYTIDTYGDVNDENIKEEFKKSMDEEGIEVDRLPIVNFTVTRISESLSLIVISVHLVKKIFVYTIDTCNEQFHHKLIHKLDLDDYPNALKLDNSLLFVYIDKTCEILQYTLTKNSHVGIEFVKKTAMFKNIDMPSDIIQKQSSIKLLYKRKFDNVQEYQERKKQRLGIVE